MQRNTPQRVAIRSLFTERGRPLSPQEVLDKAATQVEGLSLATVYRTLKSLTEAGEIVPVEVPGEPARYELGGKDHHHHFHCTSCGKVFEVEGCVGPEVDRLAPSGFKVESHELTLVGRCKACAKSA